MHLHISKIFASSFIQADIQDFIMESSAYCFIAWENIPLSLRQRQLPKNEDKDEFYPLSNSVSWLWLWPKTNCLFLFILVKKQTRIVFFDELYLILKGIIRIANSIYYIPYHMSFFPYTYNKSEQKGYKITFTSFSVRSEQAMLQTHPARSPSCSHSAP